MLDKCSDADWLKAEDEIFEKLAIVDTGFLSGAPVQELASVGIVDYRNVFSSHHKLVYRRIEGDTLKSRCLGSSHVGGDKSGCSSSKNWGRLRPSNHAESRVVYPVYTTVLEEISSC